MLHTLNGAFETVIQISWQAGVLVVLILAAQWVLKRRLSPGWRCAMWGLVLVRLAMPAMPSSRWSLWGMTQAASAAPVPVHVSTEGEATVIRSRIVAPMVAARVVEVSKPRSWGEVLAWIWAAGVLAVLARAGVCGWRLHRRIRTDRREPDEVIQRVSAELCGSLGIRGTPEVVVSSAVSVPSVFGALRPMLLMPPGIESRLSEAEVRMVMLHELMHIKRRDVMLGMIFGLFNAIHWFNPLLWLGSSRFRLDRELACDASLLRKLPGDARQEYGRTILRVLEDLGAGRSPLGAVALVGSRSSVHARLCAIARPVRGGAVVAILGMLIIAAVGCATFTDPPRRVAGPEIEHAFSARRTELITRSVPVQSVQKIIQEAHRERFTVIDTAAGPTSQPGELAPPATNLTGTAIQDRSPLPPPVEPAKLVAALMKAIEPGSWRTRGGSGMAELRGEEVLITQTHRIHDKLQSMIQFSGHQIVVTTRFLTADGPKLEWERSRQDRWNPYGGLQMWGDPLSEQDAEALVRSLDKSQSSTLLTAPRLTLLNGERATVKVSTETAYVKDLTPVVVGDAMAFDPTVDVVDSGITLNCTAEIASDGQGITLNLNPKLQRLRALVPHPVHVTEKDGKKITRAFVQIPHLETIEFDRTIRVPSGQTMLLKVGTIVGEVERKGLLGRSVEPHEQNFYLLVAATILDPQGPQ